MLWEGRRMAKELESALKLAETAESSRVERLDASMHEELAVTNKKLDAILDKSAGGGAG